ncbi:aldo/keto reductase [Nocardiopsis sediminis]|uniref:Aldo/keto reductase n=1 Tax=Nocardiopsis sediminis TaxID=1778267 RepID=A0ABV8FKX2_9ACTN
MFTVPEVTLNNGVRIPQLGFGSAGIDAADTVDVVGTAIGAGYRSIDTAAAYGNEGGVGAAVRQSGLDRERLFITSKVANADHGYDATLRAFDESLHRLDLEWLDLYLIHWPLPARDTFVGTWKALEHLYAEGRVRAIGVSNFQIEHLQRIMDEGGIVPMVNQIELHPRLTQERLRRFHARHGIATEAWSPLGQGNLLTDPAICKLAEAHGKTPAQVIIRWHLQIGTIAIPKSATADRIRANCEVFDFELSDGDIDAISALNADQRFGPDPDAFDFVGD